MDTLEPQRAVTDAILLERAARVLDRRKNDFGLHLAEQLEMEALAYKLRRKAGVLRQEAESGG